MTTSTRDTLRSGLKVAVFSGKPAADSSDCFECDRHRRIPRERAGLLSFPESKSSRGTLQVQG